MATRRALTGGTGDVNPQFVTLNATQTGTDTTTTVAFPIPIQRLGTSRGSERAQVMELLKIFCYIETILPSNAAWLVQASLSTVGTSTTGTDISDPRTIVRFLNRLYFNTSGATISQMPHVVDFTDGAGHGILIASDQIYLNIVSQNTSASVEITFKVMYRWKNVSITEYVGIVQSQQG